MSIIYSTEKMTSGDLISFVSQPVIGRGGLRQRHCRLHNVREIRQ